MNEVYLTFDDAVATQFGNAVPVLREFGFGATFFITCFSGEWRAQHAQTLLTDAQIKSMSDFGFEFGNHTLTHAFLPNLDNDGIRREISAMEEWFAARRIAKPTTFAYPGGPFCEKAVPILREMGYTHARTVEDPFSLPRPFDPMRIPSIALDDSHPEHWTQAMSVLDAGLPLVLCYHGTPDRVHPWVNTEAESFRKQMLELKERNCTVRPLSAL